MHKDAYCGHQGSNPGPLGWESNTLSSVQPRPSESLPLVRRSSDSRPFIPPTVLFRGHMMLVCMIYERMKTLSSMKLTQISEPQVWVAGEAWRDKPEEGLGLVLHVEV